MKLPKIMPKKGYKQPKDIVERRIAPLRGKKRPDSAILPMRKGFLKWARENPEKALKISIKNLPAPANGENNGNWKGGITPFWRSFRTSKKYLSWRKSIIDRYGGMCADCSSHKRIEAHHIVPISECIGLAYHLANGVALCSDCHRKTDSYGKRNAEKAWGLTIFVRSIPMSWNLFSTAGNWGVGEDGSILVTLTETSDWRYQAIVLMHEMTEIFWCKNNAVTGEACDAFDAIWEKELNSGIHRPEEEAGFDKRCPYRGGHVWGARIEHLFCWILGVKWRVYCDYWDDFFKKIKP